MNLWHFLDRLTERIDARSIAGAGIFALTCVILWMIAEFPELADNELFKVIAQAIVVQGLIGLAMAGWFTVRSGKDKGDV